MELPSLFDEPRRVRLLADIQEAIENIRELESENISDQRWLESNASTAHYDIVKETRSDITGRTRAINAQRQQIANCRNQLGLINVKYIGNQLSGILKLVIDNTR